LLLTDGTVIAHVFCTGTWYRLAPDNTGSYVNGTWSQIASMPSGYAPLYFASQVLPDGRVIVEGGEFNGAPCTTPALTKQGAIYDPAAGTWTSVNPPSGWNDIGDASSVILNNGTLMIADCCDAGSLQALFNALTLSWTATGSGKNDSNDEEGWTLLPNGEVLTVDDYVSTGGIPCLANQSEIYNPATGNWSLGPNTSSNPTIHLGDCSGQHPSFEMGPALLRPDGTVVAFGAITTNTDPTAIFNSGTSAWSAGPSILTVTDANNPACPPASGTPGGSCPYTLADAPAALLPDGNILFAASPGNWSASNSFPAPAHFFEFSAASATPANTISQVADTPSGNAPSLASFDMNFLVLPTGQVLAVETDKPGVQVYNPTGSPNPSWAPTVASIKNNGVLTTTLQIGTSYTVSGTQLNGLSQGAAYGDDVQAATNYPLVRITNTVTGHVFYAKTSGFSTMSVASGQAGTANFTLAAGTEAGASTLVVVANGIASQPTSVTVGFALSVTASGSGTVTSSPSGISCPSTCSANFNAGQQVTLTATPAGGSVFAGWSGGGCSGMGACTVTMNSAVGVTATFDFVLTVSEIGNNGGSGTVTSSPSGISCPGTCSASFSSGQQVVLTATPAGGSFFAGWTGGGCSGAGTCTVTMNAAIAVTATFDSGFVLTVSEIGNGVLTTSSGTPAAINCGTICSAGFSPGTVVTVNETQAAGWTFNGWGGACSGMGACQVPMNSVQSVSAVFTTNIAGNTWILSCNDNGSDNLSGALAGTATWTLPSSTGTPGAGDIILLNGICLGDVTVTTSDLTFTNHNDTSPSGSTLPSSAAGFVDGIQGQLEFAAGTAPSTVRNLLLEGPSSFSGGESANLYVHDGATVMVQNSWVGPGPLDGIVVQGAASTVTLLNSTVNGNGAANTAGATNGARVIDAGVLVLGAPDGSNGSTISENASGFGIALRGNASAELDGSTISGNGLGQIDATLSSDVLAAGTQVSQSSVTNPAIQAVNHSSVSLVTLVNGTGDSINGGTAGAVLAAAASQVVLHGATVQSSSMQQPTVEVSADSAAILAGGNIITATTSGGTAIQVDHSSAVLEQPATALGYASDAIDSITGSAFVQVQSSMDLGVGNLPSTTNPSLTWSVPSGSCILIQQNSSFRVSGGVAITGTAPSSCALNGGATSSTIVFQQESNGFFNLGQGGLDNIGGGGSVSCLFSSFPNAHVSGKANITPSSAQPVMIGTWAAAPSATSPGCLGP
jgi:hypothetical protein